MSNEMNKAYERAIVVLSEVMAQSPMTAAQSTHQYGKGRSRAGAMARRPGDAAARQGRLELNQQARRRGELAHTDPTEGPSLHEDYLRMAELMLEKDFLKKVGLAGGMLASTLAGQGPTKPLTPEQHLARAETHQGEIKGLAKRTKKAGGEIIKTTGGPVTPKFDVLTQDPQKAWDKMKADKEAHVPAPLKQGAQSKGGATKAPTAKPETSGPVKTRTGGTVRDSRGNPVGRASHVATKAPTTTTKKATLGRSFADNDTGPTKADYEGVKKKALKSVFDKQTHKKGGGTGTGAKLAGAGGLVAAGVVALRRRRKLAPVKEEKINPTEDSSVHEAYGRLIDIIVEYKKQPKEYWERVKMGSEIGGKKLSPKERRKISLTKTRKDRKRDAERAKAAKKRPAETDQEKDERIEQQGRDAMRVR